MPLLLLNAAVALVAATVVLSIWIGVHLAARNQMGERHFGCKGGERDEEGNAICCQEHEDCELRDRSAGRRTR